MKEKTSQVVDPAEICECNPEWSSATGNDDWDDCRCSIVTPAETNSVGNKEKS